jgi:hypothetical protein
MYLFLMIATMQLNIYSNKIKKCIHAFFILCIPLPAPITATGCMFFRYVNTVTNNINCSSFL